MDPTPGDGQDRECAVASPTCYQTQTTWHAGEIGSGGTRESAEDVGSRNTRSGWQLTNLCQPRKEGHNVDGIQEC
jgi:hypothetical protein